MLKVHSSIAHDDYLLSSYSDSGQQMVHCAFIFTFVFAEAIRWQSSSSLITQPAIALSASHRVRDPAKSLQKH